MSGLTAFLAGRYAEEWSAARDQELMAGLDESRATRDVDAKREILRRCAVHMDEPDQWPNGLVSPRAVLARQVIMNLGATYDDHPSYQPEWKP
jgi:hypothetical protein